MRPLAKPYQRIVAVETAKGLLRTEIDYPSEKPRIQELDVPGWFTERFVDFFGHHQLTGEQIRRYNYSCHSFSAHMAGEPLDTRAALARAEAIIQRRRQRSLPLGIGKQIVLGYPPETQLDGMLPHAAHSLTSLGKAALCIEVIAVGGYTALEPFQTVLAEYHSHSPGLQPFTED
jgi:hypothetical protein